METLGGDHIYANSVDHPHSFSLWLLGLVLALVLLFLIVCSLVFICVHHLWVSRGLECLVLEAEFLLSVADSEADLGITGVDDGFSGVQEWSSQDDW